MSIFGGARGGQPEATGTINNPVGSPPVGQNLLLTGTFSQTGYVQLLRNGVPEGSRVAVSVTAGLWQATVTPSDGGSYTAELWSASAGGRLLGRTSQFVVVALTSPPIITAGQSFSVLETASAPTTIGSVARTGGTPDSWAITAGNTGTAFSISSAGVLSTAAALDYETLSSYTLTIQATNSAGSSSVAVQVQVTDVLDTVPTVTGGQAFNVSESAVTGTVVGAVATTGAAPTSFSIQSGNTGTAFAISNAGVITVNAALSFATLPSYTLGIRATNGIGNSATVNVGVNVLAAAPADTVASMVVDGTGAGANAVVPFAHVFALGALPQGATLLARNASDSTDYRTQYDAKALWPDSSVKHAMLAIEIPTLADGATLPINLIKNATHASPGSQLDLATLLAARSASITITPTGGGAPQTFDLVSLAGANRWRQGTLAAETRIIASINAAAVGGVVTTARLVVDLTVLKDGAMCVDFGVRNDACMVSGTGTMQYGLSLSMDGAVQGSWSGIVQTARKIFQRSRWSVSGGAAAVQRPFVRHDTLYMARTGLAPNVDTALGVASGRIAERVSQRQAADWNTPLNNRLITKFMGQTGERDDIGVIPGWCAEWLASYNRTTQLYSMEAGEASLGIPWHAWDTTNGRWLNAVDHPTLFMDRGGAWTPVNGDASWDPEIAHHPCPTYIPYLLTGRRCMLDGTMAIASWAIMFTDGYGRGNVSSVDYTTGAGITLAPYQQQRGFAWALRSVMWAAAVAPASEQPHGSYYYDVVRGNINWALANQTAMTTATGEIHGFFYPYASGGGDFAPWQFDFVLKTMAHVVKLGWPDASTILAWMLNMGAGRFLRTTDWNNADGLNYHVEFSQNTSEGVPPFYQTWAAAKAATIAAGYSYGGDHVTIPDAYGPSAMEAIATTRAALPQNAPAARAWKWLLDQFAISMPGADAATLQWNSVKWSVPPLGQTRAGASAPAVVAAQTYQAYDATPINVPFAVVQTSGNFATSFAITGGNTGSAWVIDDAGVLTPVQTMNHAVTPTYNLTITATNANGTSSGVAVTINVGDTAPTAPTVTNGLSFSVPQNAGAGTVAGTVTLSAGTLPATWSITGGNTGGAWAINSSTGVITQAVALLDWVAVPSYTLTVQATNAAGSDTATVAMGFQALPVLTDGQNFSIVYSVANGSSAGTVVCSGNPTSFSITAGNTGNVFAITNSGVITKQGTLSMGESFTLTIQATNTVGSDTTTVAVAVTDVPQVPYDATSTTFLGIYGLHKVNQAYSGSAVRVRRASDNAEQDIGFSGNLFNTSALTTFAAGGACYATTWYDQSGNGLNMIQPTAAEQPQITNASGAVYTHASGNSQPVIYFAGSGRGFYCDSVAVGGSALGGAVDFDKTGYNNNTRILNFSSEPSATDYTSDSAVALFTHADDISNGYYAQVLRNGAARGNTSNETNNVRATMAAVCDGTNLSFYKNGTSLGSTAKTGTFAATGTLRIGIYLDGTASNSYVGKSGEACFFKATTSADVIAISAAITARYSA